MNDGGNREVSSPERNEAQPEADPLLAEMGLAGVQHVQKVPIAQPPPSSSPAGAREDQR